MVAAGALTRLRHCLLLLLIFLFLAAGANAARWPLLAVREDHSLHGAEQRPRQLAPVGGAKQLRRAAAVLLAAGCVQAGGGEGLVWYERGSGI